MSRLEDLIQSLCPDGVDFIPLEEVLDYSQPTPYIVKSTLYDDSFDTPVLTAGASFILGYTDEIKGIYCASYDKPVIIFDDFTTSFHWVDFNFKVKSSAMKILTELEQKPVVLRYVFYAMQCITYQPSQHARQWIQTYSKIRIPLPPLPVQAEIVRILDTFSGVVTELEQQLNAEQATRVRQYEHYRNSMFLNLLIDGVEEKSLGEICTDMYRGSGIKRDQVTSQGTPCVRYGEIYTTYSTWFDECVSHTNADEIQNKKFFEHGDILFAITGESVEEIAKSTVYLGYERCLAGGDIVVMKHQQIPKYIAYALTTEHAQDQKSKGKVKSKVVHSSVPAIKQIKIPIPPLEDQEQIVSILDRFDALVNDLKSGLPAEIALRRKQYEYYRDKLLTFPAKQPPL